MNVDIYGTLSFAKYEKYKTEENLRNAMKKNASYREVDELRKKLEYWKTIIAILSQKIGELKCKT